ncbi:MAG: Uma2 family endonuclease [Verrucomicrobia bacterium]|nr:Uma2 family endonuclease [Verrucomicrobiota bacterium]
MQSRLQGNRLAIRIQGAYVFGMTWAEIGENRWLASLPNRVETDRWGRIVMSPPPRSRHGEYQLEIGGLLRDLLRGGRALTECPIQTREGVKAADVAWASRERRASRANDPVFLIAPELCVEVQSPSDVEAELMERKALFFELGAHEFWLCDLEEGRMTHEDMAVPVGLDAAFELRKLGIRQDFVPAPEVEGALGGMAGQSDGQRGHDRTVAFCVEAHNRHLGGSMLPASDCCG